MKRKIKFMHLLEVNAKLTQICCLTIFGSLMVTSESFANGYPLQCRHIFHDNSTLMIAMNPLYRGENAGKYIDPVTHKPWMVKYFNREELKKFEVVLKDGIFYDLHGKKMSSEFDAESMSFDHALLVIDKNFKVYLMPFESRGTYHHSSLSNGDDIIFAGTAAFHHGALRELSNSSGHYKPSGKQTLAVLKALQKRGANLQSLTLTGQVATELSQSTTVDAKSLAILLKGAP